MLENIAGFVRTVTRPIVTYTLVATQCLLAVGMVGDAVGAAEVTGAKEASAALAPFTMMALTFWFKDRSDEAASTRFNPPADGVE